MTDDAPTRRTDIAPVDIDPTVAHAARVYDYLLGGVDNDVEPGLVPVDQWRPDAAVPDTDWVARFHGVVARKP